MTERAYNPRIVHLPGTRLTPDVVLHRTLGEIDRIKALTIVIQWDDDSFTIDFSQQKMSELCMGALLLQGEAIKIARGDDE